MNRRAAHDDLAVIRAYAAITRTNADLFGEFDMPKECPAEIAALLDSDADFAAIQAALVAHDAGRANGIKTKTTEWISGYSNKCATGLTQQYCVHIEYDNGEIMDRCGPVTCQT